MALGLFDLHRVQGARITQSEIGWDTSPYPASDSSMIDTHLGRPSIVSPVRGRTLYEILTFTPRPVYDIKRGGYGPVERNLDFPGEYSSRLAYGHWGVGEKGPASKSLSAWLGTYQDQSRVDPMKAKDYSNDFYSHLGRNVGKYASYGRTAYVMWQGWQEAAKMGDPFLAKSLAAGLTAAGRYPQLIFHAGLGHAGGTVVDYLRGYGTLGGVIRSTPFVGKELISYPTSHYLGRKLLEYAPARSFGGALLGKGSQLYQAIGEKLGSKWFIDKAASWKIGEEVAKGALAGMTPELERQLGTLFQELVDPVVDIAAFLGLRAIARPVGNWVDARHLSHKHAYGHSGVGEKGPSSRYNANKLGTYEESSKVDVLKAVTFAKEKFEGYFKRKFFSTVRSNMQLLTKEERSVYSDILRYDKKLLNTKINVSTGGPSYELRGIKLGPIDTSKGIVNIISREHMDELLEELKSNKAVSSVMSRAYSKKTFTDEEYRKFFFAHEFGHAHDFITGNKSILTEGRDEYNRLGYLLTKKGVSNERIQRIQDILYRRIPAERSADNFAIKVLQHSGPGEKGVASRKIVEDLRTYNTHSTVNPIKAALLAELELATKYTSTSMIKEDLNSLMKKVLDKYPVSKQEVSLWLKNGNLTRKLRKRGIDLREVRQELQALNNKSPIVSTEEKVFLSRQEKKAIIKKDRRQIQSMLSGKEYSSKMAFDNMSPTVPHTYGKQSTALQTPNIIHEPDNTLNITSEPSMDFEPVEKNVEESVGNAIHSHVNIRMTDEINMKHLDKVLTKKLKGR